MCRRSRTFQRADCRPSPTASVAWPTRRSRAVWAWRRQSSVSSIAQGCSSPAPIFSSSSPRPAASRSRVWRASTSRDAGSTSETPTPTAAPRMVSTARRQPAPCSPVFTAVSTTSTLTGICRAAEAGSRSTSAATPIDAATSRPTVNPFNPSASPSAKATKTPSTTAPLRWSAVRSDARTDTATVTTAVSDASTGAESPVTTPAIHHDRPAANPALATKPISVEVGGVHETASARRRHSPRTPLPGPRSGCVTTAGRLGARRRGRRACHNSRGTRGSVPRSWARQRGHVAWCWPSRCALTG